MYCCPSLGWVMPDVFFDHRWDTSRSPDEVDLGAWAGIKPGK